MNPILLGQAEEIDMIQPQVRQMLLNPGFYIGGDTDQPELNVPLLSNEGRVHSMVVDSELDPLRFLPTLKLVGPFRIDEQPVTPAAMQAGVCTGDELRCHDGHGCECAMRGAPGIDSAEVLRRIDQADVALGCAGLTENNILRSELREARAAVATMIDASPKGGSEACVWTDDGEGNWHTACGEIFVLLEGSPADNKIAHCPFCGSHISENAQAGAAEVQP